MTDPNRKDNEGGSASRPDEPAKGFPDFIITPPGGPGGSSPAGAAANAAAGASGTASPFTPDAAAGPGAGRGAYGVASDPPSYSRPAPPPALPAAPPPKARGGGLALLAALVAMLAAGASIAAPSLRPLLAETLRKQFGDHEFIAVITGTADTRPPGQVQLDIDTFDRRLGALAQALESTPGGQPVSPETLERFVTAAGDDARFGALESALRSAEGQVATLSQALAALETRLAEADGRTDRLEAADGGFADRLAAAQGALGDLTPRVAAAQDAAAAATAAAAASWARADAATAKADAATVVANDALASADGALVGANTTAALATVTAAKADEAADQMAGLSGAMDILGATASEIGSRLAAVESHLTDLAAAVQGNADAAAANGTAIQAAVEEMRGGNEAMAARIAALETGAGAIAGRLDAAEKDLAATRGNVTTTGAAVRAAASDLAGLVARTAAIETHLARVNGGTASALLALSSRIRQALEDGESFTGEVAAVRALAGNNTELTGAIDTLQQLASRGGPTLTLLRREFNLAAQKIIEVEEASGPAWYMRTVSTMSAQVSSWFGWVQPPMPAPGEEARAVVTEAAKSFTLGRIDEAVHTLKTISGPGAEAAEPWIRLAQVRVDAERALRALSDAALERLAKTAP